MPRSSLKLHRALMVLASLSTLFACGRFWSSCQECRYRAREWGAEKIIFERLARAANGMARAARREAELLRSQAGAAAVVLAQYETVRAEEFRLEFDSYQTKAAVCEQQRAVYQRASSRPWELVPLSDLPVASLESGNLMHCFDLLDPAVDSTNLIEQVKIARHTQRCAQSEASYHAEQCMALLPTESHARDSFESRLESKMAILHSMLAEGHGADQRRTWFAFCSKHASLAKGFRDAEYLRCVALLSMADRQQELLHRKIMSLLQSQRQGELEPLLRSREKKQGRD